MAQGDSPGDPAAHQPAKADMGEDVGIDATPEALAWAITRGGAEQQKADNAPRDAARLIVSS